MRGAAWKDTHTQLVGIRGNPLKAMSNRVGKREREARRRHKRGWTYGSRTGAVLQPLKLGRRKMRRLAASTQRLGSSFICYGMKLPKDMTAVPVANPESRGANAHELEWRSAGIKPSRPSSEFAAAGNRPDDTNGGFGT